MDRIKESWIKCLFLSVWWIHIHVAVYGIETFPVKTRAKKEAYMSFKLAAAIGCSYKCAIESDPILY